MNFKVSNIAPVVLFVYNRPIHTAETLRALAANTLANQTPLIVYSDAARSENDSHLVDETRRLLKTIVGFASVIVHEREKNLGLADSIADGVSAVISEYGRVIIVEDDIVTSPYFLEYMNTALDRYEKDEKVMHIAAHMQPISIKGLPESFFLRQSSCWGWATWARAWQHFHRRGQEFVNIFTEDDIKRFNLDGAYDYWSQLLANVNGSLKTWAVYWYACVFIKGGLCLHPRQSLVQNIGFDGSGENCGTGEGEAKVSKIKAPTSYPDIIKEHKTAMQRFQRQLHTAPAQSLIIRIQKSIKRLLNE